MDQQAWTLLFHECVIAQVSKLRRAALRAQERAPESAAVNANVKLFHALSHLMLNVIPDDPSRNEYRQGNTLGPEHRHWRRAKIGRRFRLFFRYDSKSRVIVYAWINDEHSMRSSGSHSDPYVVFRKMLDRGNPPDDWNALLLAAQSDLDALP